MSNSDSISSTFWEDRDISLGVPVGCLVVPKQHMAIVQTTLSSEGKAGRGVWLRPNGTVRMADNGSFQVHLSAFGALVFEMRRQNVPVPILELLKKEQIQWLPGERLVHLEKQPKRRKLQQIACHESIQVASSRPTAVTSKFRFCELFAGIGGFRLGLESLGGTCVFSSEMDPFAAQTYALNFGSPPSAGDMTTVESSDIPPHDVLVGGFPCQSFSMAGLQKGIDDTSNGRLYLEACRVLCASQPKAFILENVANLYIIDGGEWHDDFASRKPGKAFTAIMAALTKCGYTTQTRVLNAKDYKVPQYRDRLFFVGFLDPEAAKRFVWPASANPTPTVRSILEANDSEAVQAAALTPAQCQKIRLSTTSVHRISRLDGIARTLMSSYRSGWQKHSEFVVNDDNGSHRFYTAREAARIMGFPEDYVVPGCPSRSGDNKAFESYQRFYRQIGNAVCPPVIEALGASICKALAI